MIPIKTDRGAQVMKDRSINLNAHQRSALILCDGKRSVEDVLRMTSAVGVSMQDLQALADQALIEFSKAAVAVAAMGASQTASVAEPPVEVSTSASSAADFQTALSAAVTLCSTLGFKGFGLNLSLTGVDSIEKLQKLAPEIRRVAGDAKYRVLHELIFGQKLQA